VTLGFLAVTSVDQLCLRPPFRMLTLAVGVVLVWVGLQAAAEGVEEAVAAPAQ
jgi:hypothetical protein